MNTETHSPTVSDATFQAEVLNFPGTVLVDFWAEWCTPCRVVGPVVDALAEKYASDPNVRILKMDVDANQETSNTYRIMSIPAMKIFKNGMQVDEMIGAAPANMIEDFLKKNL